jgi:sulfur carrier protein
LSIFVNGQPQTLPVPPTLIALLEVLSPASPFAIACNGNFVPRGAYDDLGLKAGDEIDIVRPAAGG